MSTVKVTLSLPAAVLHDAERRLARRGESRSALIARVVREALREIDERDAEERYARGYRGQPETEADRAANRALTQALLVRRSGE